MFKVQFIFAQGMWFYKMYDKAGIIHVMAIEKLVSDKLEAHKKEEVGPKFFGLKHFVNVRDKEASTSTYNTTCTID